jgi:hypothetical protein
MIIYNVTVSVEDDIKDAWLEWMRATHIPELMSLGFFLKAQINRIIIQDDSDNTFAITYTCSSMKELHQYQINFSSELQKKHSERFGEKAVSFRTLMEVIEEF